MWRTVFPCVLLLRTREFAGRQVLRQLRHQARGRLDHTDGDCGGNSNTGTR